MTSQQLADEIKRIGELNLSDAHVCDNGLCVDVEHMTAACKLVKHLHAELVAARESLIGMAVIYDADGEHSYSDGEIQREKSRQAINRLARLAELNME